MKNILISTWTLIAYLLIFTGACLGIKFCNDWITELRQSSQDYKNKKDRYNKLLVNHFEIIEVFKSKLKSCPSFRNIKYEVKIITDAYPLLISNLSDLELQFSDSVVLRSNDKELISQFRSLRNLEYVRESNDKQKFITEELVDLINQFG